VIARVWIELTVAVLAILGAGVCWLDSQHTVRVAPVTDGQPVTTSVVYDPQFLLLTMLLLATGGMLAVVGIGHTVVMTTSRSKRSRGRC
jgi:hypothetical protein